MAAYSQKSQDVPPEETEVLVDSQSDAFTVNIDDQIQLDESIAYGDLIRDYTFTGNANDLIVAYWNADNGVNYGASVSLYGDEGNVIDEGGDYSEAIDFSEYNGRHRTFLLPATGTYRLAFSRQPANYQLSMDGEAVSDNVSSYLLRVRAASDYERLTVFANASVDEERWQDALDMFTAAIAQSPDQPFPYIGRLWSQGGLALDGMGLDEFNVTGPEDLYALYETLDASAQAQVIFDLKKFEETMAVVMDEENLTEDELDIELAFFSAIAQYFETGEQPEYLRSLVTGS